MSIKTPLSIAAWKRLSVEARDLGVTWKEKRGLGWAALQRFLRIFGVKNLNTNFVTTIGGSIYTPIGWLDKHAETENGCELLAHELVHVRQFKRAGLGSARTGIIPMFFAYCLLPIPIGFAYGRWRLERGAYVSGLKMYYSLRGRNRASEDEIRWLVENMTGPKYAYTMALSKKSVEKYFRKQLQ